MRRVLPLLCLFAAILSAQYGEPKPHTLTVTGTADVVMAPDLCQMSVTITVTRQRNAVGAYSEVKNRVKALTDALKAQSVSPKDIETQGLSITPEFISSGRSKVSFFDDYSVSQALLVKVRDLDKVPAVFDAILAEEAKVTAVSFTVQDQEQYVVKARLDAVNKARAQAEAIARAVGVALLKPVAVSEHTSPDWGSRYSPPMSQMSAQAGSNLAPGQVRLVQNVTITYEME